MSVKVQTMLSGFEEPDMQQGVTKSAAAALAASSPAPAAEKPAAEPTESQPASSADTAPEETQGDPTQRPYSPDLVGGSAPRPASPAISAPPASTTPPLAAPKATATSALVSGDDRPSGPTQVSRDFDMLDLPGSQSQPPPTPATHNFAPYQRCCCLNGDMELFRLQPCATCRAPLHHVCMGYLAPSPNVKCLRCAGLPVKGSVELADHRRIMALLKWNGTTSQSAVTTHVGASWRRVSLFWQKLIEMGVLVPTTRGQRHGIPVCSAAVMDKLIAPFFVQEEPQKEAPAADTPVPPVPPSVLRPVTVAQQNVTAQLDKVSLSKRTQFPVAPSTQDDLGENALKRRKISVVEKPLSI